jgi:hypothetical protein
VQATRSFVLASKRDRTYLVLLRAGFVRLTFYNVTGEALTSPFHPYQIEFVIDEALPGGIFSVTLSIVERLHARHPSPLSRFFTEFPIRHCTVVPLWGFGAPRDHNRLLLLGWLTFDDPRPSGFNPVLPMSFLRLHLPVVIPIFLAEDLT